MLHLGPSIAQMNRSRAIALADRSATLALNVMTAVNLLFLVAFLAMLAFAAGNARADAAQKNTGHMAMALGKSETGDGN